LTLLKFQPSYYWNTYF